MLLLVGLFALGAVFGPVIVALGAAAYYPDSDVEGKTNAAPLVDAYQTRLGPMALWLVVDPPEDGRECGYAPSELFPAGIVDVADARRAGTWAPYEGYAALDHWRDRQRDEDYVAAISDDIGQNLSGFEAGFLRRCIQQTVFAALCMDRLRDASETSIGTMHLVNAVSLRLVSRTRSSAVMWMA